MLLSERLKKLRLDKNMSQVELAKLMNTTKQTIYKYEHDIIGNIPLDRIEQYSRIFRVTPAYICGWEEEPTDTTKLMALYERLNERGKNKLLDYADDLMVAMYEIEISTENRHL